MTAVPSVRDLPSVDRLLQETLGRGLLGGEPRELVVQAAREVLDEARRGLRELKPGFNPQPRLADLPERVERRVRQASRPPPRPGINATGVGVPTNLGRAPPNP